MKHSLIIVFLTFICSCSDNSPETVSQTPLITRDSTSAPTMKSLNIDTMELSGEMKGLFLDSLNDRDQFMYMEFSQFLNKELIGKKQKTGNMDSSQCDIIYLGDIYDLQDNSIYSVISQFCRIQMANSIRGNSKMIFLNQKEERIRIYYLNMPDELPIAIEENAIIFKSETEEKGVKISGGLPPLFCIPDKGCFE
jgi:hypothetical protein